MTGDAVGIKEKDYLIFDGDCGVCTRSAEICARIDSGKLFEIVPFQLISEGELGRFGLDHQKCSGQMQVITSHGRVHGGAFAINYFLFKHEPWSVLVLIIYVIPVLLLLEVIGYRMVARYRARLSQLLGLPACRIEEQ